MSGSHGATAGDLNRALSWDDRGFRNVGFAQDNLLENLLNQCAEGAYAEVPESVRQQAVVYLRQMIARKGNTSQVQAAAETLGVPAMLGRIE